jgi:hypothetical protein
MSIASVSQQMLQPLTDCLTPEVAERIVDARLDQETQSRIDALARKANRGILSDAERDEYSQYVEYIDLVAIVKAKARSLLRQSGH